MSPEKSVSNRETVPSEVAWPGVRFTYGVPPIEIYSAKTADEVAELYPDKTVWEICDQIGVKVKYPEVMKVDQARIYIPPDIADALFEFWVNPERPRREPSHLEKYIDPEWSNEIYDSFMLGHELGHTFFFDWNPNDLSKRPDRSKKSSPEEEKFCDEFAMCLLQNLGVLEATG